MRPYGLRRGRHQGSEGRWEALRALSSRSFCSYDSRRVSLWDLSAGLRYTTFHTDQYEVYKGVIPAEQHRAITKQARKTNHIERFNNTLRQRVARLVRETLSFSKKLANHIGAIKYFTFPRIKW